MTRTFLVLTDEVSSSVVWKFLFRFFGELLIGGQGGKVLELRTRVRLSKVTPPPRIIREFL